jgi:hypothetical protein
MATDKVAGRTLFLFIVGGVFVLALGCNQEGDISKDMFVTVPDGSAQLDTGQPDGDAALVGPNSGKTCDDDSDCPTGDACLRLQDWNKGMCFGPCVTFKAACPTVDDSKYHSVCSMTNLTQTQMYCLFVCQWSAVDYECPDPATQECAVMMDGLLLVCRPK